MWMGFGIVIVVRLFCQLWRQKDGGREFEEIEENLILIIVEERCREVREFDRLDREVFNLVES